MNIMYRRQEVAEKMRFFSVGRGKRPIGMVDILVSLIYSLVTIGWYFTNPLFALLIGQLIGGHRYIYTAINTNYFTSSHVVPQELLHRNITLIVIQLSH